MAQATINEVPSEAEIKPAEDVAKLLGYSDEDVRKINEQSGEILGSLKVPEIPTGGDKGPEVFVTFVSDDIKMVNTEEGDRPTAIVKDDNGVRYTLWLTAESLKRAYMQLRSRLKSVAGVRVAIWKVKYTHPKYKETTAYRMQQIV